MATTFASPSRIVPTANLGEAQRRPFETRTPPASRPVQLTASGSLLLDAVRFAAALAVLLHHFTDSKMSRGFPHLGALGHEAVCVFFVLSGFVIRLITSSRAGTVGAYAIDRASRLYSVIVPALVCSVVCEALAAHLRPSLYELVRDGYLWREVPTHLLANLTFTAQCWGYGLNPLSNAPFWSLSYECVYYAVYAVIHYRVRRRWLWASLLLLAAGPSIALLFPVWLLGVLACDLYVRLSRDLHGVRKAGASLLGLVLLLGGLGRPIAHLLRRIGHENRGVWLTALLRRHITHAGRLADRTGKVPWLTEASLSFLFIGALTAAGIVFGLLVLDRLHPGLPPRLRTSTRTVADSTFTLYLFHVPLMLFADVLIGQPVAGWLPATALLGGIVLVAIPVSVALDRFKLALRNGLRRRFRTRNPSTFACPLIRPTLPGSIAAPRNKLVHSRVNSARRTDVARRTSGPNLDSRL